MKFGVCVCLSVWAIATLAAGQKVITYHSNGAVASIDSFSNGNTFGSLSVTRNGVGPSAQTNMFLSFTIFDENFNVVTSSFGFGTIPGNSLQGDGTGAMALDLDLSKAPDYTLCTFTNAGTICASPGQGTINLSWRRLNLFSSHSVDNLIQSYPPDIKLVRRETPVPRLCKERFSARHSLITTQELVLSARRLIPFLFRERSHLLCPRP